MAHTYRENPNRQQVDARVETLDFSAYDLVLLGGDLTQQSTLEASNMSYLDSVFNLQNPNVHWAIGNHDYMQPQLVPEATGKPLFYTFHRKGVTFLVLDSQLDSCSISGAQRTLFQAVIDTMRQSSHFVLMQHKLCWLWQHPELQGFEKQANADFGPQPWDTNPNNFYADIYPSLVALEQQGIEVICLSGDVGVRANQFAHRTAEGIDFLASGLSRTGEADDVVLRFVHKPEARTLSWHFAPI